jgi:NDP-sugar pyrophosphorylase family protein
MNKSMTITEYTFGFAQHFPHHVNILPWLVPAQLQNILIQMLKNLSSAYSISGNIAVHNTAVIEEGVVLKGPLIIADNVFVGAHAYLRGGVFLAPGVSVGPGCEIKTSIILEKTSLAHFNFVGDSILGTEVNMEAGSIIANHHNDRADKAIHIRNGNDLLKTEVTKFGALVGDGCKIGANAVLSPGTILPRNTIVRRLELIRQD